MIRRFLPALFLVLLAACRWPGLLPPNFSPVYALVFCAGAFWPGRGGWQWPLAVLLASDLILDLYYHVSLLDGYLVLNYAGYAVLFLIGRRLSKRQSFVKLLAGGMLGAVLFYVITNTAAWVNPAPGPLPQAPYPQTLLGWLQALTVGSAPWPPTWTFFRNTLLSGGLFTGVFVGLMRLCGWESVTDADAVEDEEEEEAESPAGEPEESD